MELEGRSGVKDEKKKRGMSERKFHRDGDVQLEARTEDVTHHTGQFFGPRGQREGAWVPLSLPEETGLLHSLERAHRNHLLHPNQSIYAKPKKNIQQDRSKECVSVRPHRRLTKEEMERRSKENMLTEVGGKAVEAEEQVKVLRQRINEMEEQMKKTEEVYKEQV